MIAILTPEYTRRHWTQRELDVFDIDADRDERRVLAIEFPNTRVSDRLDQIFLVHQRIAWEGPILDPGALWKLHCGLIGKPPGQRTDWAAKGHELLAQTTAAVVDRSQGDAAAVDDVITVQPLLGRILKVAGPLERLQADLQHGGELQPGSAEALIRQARQALSIRGTGWIPVFAAIRESVSSAAEDDLTIRHVANDCWAFGYADISAVLTLALISAPNSVATATSDLVWPFVDLGCHDVATWALARHALVSTNKTEVWFSWAVSQRHWELLRAAAQRAPAEMADHFTWIATMASDIRCTYAEAEREYDYGKMITPWNNLHLSWLAARLQDVDASVAHAHALCATAAHGDQRAGRFISRLSAWSIFAITRESKSLHEELEVARRLLGMAPSDTLARTQQRVREMWRQLMLH